MKSFNFVKEAFSYKVILYNSTDAFIKLFTMCSYTFFYYEVVTRFEWFL